MEELIMGDEITKEFFITAFKDHNIVPILGAGFTAGMPAVGGNTVPSGIQLKEYMVKQIIKIRTEISKNDLMEEPFSSVADLFEDTYKDSKDIKKMGVSRYFYEHFTNVKIRNEIQKSFLNCIEWDYIYTLNIDTGIEDTDYEKWEIFYPNNDFDEYIDYGDKKKLYKIHGDVNQFIKSLDYDTMILTESQYIKSLDKNKKFHDMLSSDCGSKNIIYIGCSLNDEIDIKYSVLSDRNRNYTEKKTYRIYVTAEKLSGLKKIKLDRFNISHYIQLQSSSDYELFYSFLLSCYQESRDVQNSDIDNLGYQRPEIVGADKTENIRYLADIKKDKRKLPYYYFASEVLNELNFSLNKINVIIGRRFSGKTMLAYNILDYYQNYRRYFVTGQESVDMQTIQKLMKLKNALIVFDSGSIESKIFMQILNIFDAENKNIVYIFINSQDDLFNCISYYTKKINFPIDHTLIGKLSSEDIKAVNKKLDDIGISRFDEKENILDNTLRIANVYKENIVSDYTISGKNELVIIIWLLAKNKMYFVEIVSLGLDREYKKIIEKFAPFLQEEKCKKSESNKHSASKIICNGKLGLLQILNSYVYPQENKIGKVVLKQRHRYICDSIYHILKSFNRVDSNVVKKFIMFDTLNDIFSRKYSWEGIDYVVSSGERGKELSGASGLIQMIYNDDNIQKLEASDPNYWLQKAKSVHIAFRKQNDINILYEGIDWALKAEQDSRIKVDNGENKYKRTMSNAVIQVAIMFGKVARLNNYSIMEDNKRAIEYYYKGFSDSNNAAAAKTILSHSRGTEDFKSLKNYILANLSHMEQKNECSYLINISIKNGDIYPR